ncbi:hypothetical protein TNCV_1383481 [Trichonephila clavipes]|nr:hypothetical protein TNCV_1383481 [Trichonephila clavipes]
MGLPEPPGGWTSTCCSTEGAVPTQICQDMGFQWGCGRIVVKFTEPPGQIQSLLLGRLERNDLQKFIWGAENSLRALEHTNTVSSECLEND